MHHCNDNKVPQKVMSIQIKLKNDTETLARSAAKSNCIVIKRKKHS